jgi:hypothetical protein
MIRRHAFLALGLAGVLGLQSPQVSAQEGADGPAFYRVQGVKDAVGRSKVAATGALIIEADADSVVFEATPEELKSLAGLGLVAEPLSSEQTLELLPFPQANSDYHDYAEMTAEIQAAARRFPTIFTLTSIGQSREGRELWLGKISDNVNTDEREPEFLFTHHIHAREHLTVEQGLYTLRMLTQEYGSNPQITDLVNRLEIWIVFDINPDGGEFDIATGNYVSWRKNRQPNPGVAAVGTDLNRNWGFQWGCCGGSSGNTNSGTYRGVMPFSGIEIGRVKDFVDSRVIGGVQQISAALDFHTFGELVLWPYGYTFEDVPADMDPDDQATFVAMGQAMAASNGYTPQQASDLYIADGVSIDWKYGEHGIFAYTFEMYPTSGRDGGFYPPDEVIARETARNREAILYLLSNADCPYRAIGKEAEFCTVLEPNRNWERPDSPGRPGRN